MPCVFSGNQVDFSQNTDCPQCNIIEVSNGSWNDEQHSISLESFRDVCSEGFRKLSDSCHDGLTFVSLNVSITEERGICDQSTIGDNSTSDTVDQLVFDLNDQEVFRCRENVIRDGARLAAFDFDKRAIQDGIRFIVGDNFKSSIALKLLDQRIRHEDFKPWFQGVVFECRYRNRLDVAQVGGFYRAEMVTTAG